MEKPDYIMSVSFFLDRSNERLQPRSTRVSLGEFVRPLTNDEIQDILYAARMRYGEIMRGEAHENCPAGFARGVRVNPTCRECPAFGDCSLWRLF